MKGTTRTNHHNLLSACHQRRLAGQFLCPLYLQGHPARQVLRLSRQARARSTPFPACQISPSPRCRVERKGKGRIGRASERASELTNNEEAEGSCRSYCCCCCCGGVCGCVVKESSLPAEGAPRLAIDDDAVFCVEVLYLPLEASSFSSFSSSACHAHASQVSSSLSPDPVGRY